MVIYLALAACNQWLESFGVISHPHCTTFSMCETFPSECDAHMLENSYQFIVIDTSSGDSHSEVKASGSLLEGACHFPSRPAGRQLRHLNVRFIQLTHFQRSEPNVSLSGTPPLGLDLNQCKEVGCSAFSCFDVLGKLQA